MSTGGYFGFTPTASQLSNVAVAAAVNYQNATPVAQPQQPQQPPAYANVQPPPLSVAPGGAVNYSGTAPGGVAGYSYAVAATSVAPPVVPGTGGVTALQPQAGPTAPPPQQAVAAPGPGPAAPAAYQFAAAAPAAAAPAAPVAIVTRPASSSIGNYTYSSAGTGAGYFGNANPVTGMMTACIAPGVHCVATTSGIVPVGSSMSYSTGLTPAIQAVTPTVRVTPVVTGNSVTPVTVSGYDTTLYANYFQKVAVQPAQQTATVVLQPPQLAHQPAGVQHQQPQQHHTNIPQTHFAPVVYSAGGPVTSTNLSTRFYFAAAAPAANNNTAPAANINALPPGYAAPTNIGYAGGVGPAPMAAPGTSSLTFENLVPSANAGGSHRMDRSRHGYTAGTSGHAGTSGDGGGGGHRSGAVIRRHSRSTSSSSRRPRESRRSGSNDNRSSIGGRHSGYSSRNTSRDRATTMTAASSTRSGSTNSNRSPEPPSRSGGSGHRSFSSKPVSRSAAGSQTSPSDTQQPMVLLAATPAQPNIPMDGTSCRISAVGNKVITIRRGSAGFHSRGGGRGRVIERKQQETHFCDVCKISCGGAMTYKEHLEGNRHKKKEKSLKIAQSKQHGSLTKTAYRCEVCMVTLTGKDTYETHVRGSKHQKTIKLLQSLGKPVPTTEPTVIPSRLAASRAREAAMSGDIDIGIDGVEFAEDDDQETEPVGEDYVVIIKSEPSANHANTNTLTYLCKLCDCKFNDQTARDMHVKGRRHRLQFKKKVNPDIEVDMKYSTRQKIEHDRMRRELNYYRSQQQRFGGMNNPMFESGFGPGGPPRGPGPWGGPPMGPVPYGAGPMAHYDGPPGGMPPRGLGPPMGHMHGGDPSGMESGPYGPGPHMRPGPPTLNDSYVQKKHDSIYPSASMLEAIQTLVTNTEKALKGVSDDFGNRSLTEVVSGRTDTKPNTSQDSDSEDSESERLLMGVMRVGSLAKGLLLADDLIAEVVILCATRPTMALLYKIYELLPKFYEEHTDEKYSLSVVPAKGYIRIVGKVNPSSWTKSYEISMLLHLTSSVYRDQDSGEVTDDFARGGQDSTSVDPPDVLDKQHCLEALAWLRHAKWFQSQCAHIPTALVILRVMRDLCERIPTWRPLGGWVLELFVEKVLSSACGPLSPGEAFRRVFEAVSYGVLLDCGPGIVDPCERGETDATIHMTTQQREDITASAQHAIRLIAFDQIYKVLGIDKIPAFHNKSISSSSAGSKRTVATPEPNVADVSRTKKIKSEV